jgi:DNA repair protein RecN (Recombination protein N)
VIELEVGAGRGSSPAAEWCERNGLPLEEPLLLRRQLEPGGRSRAFVNDTPVRLEQLRELGGLLVHVHSQHHTLLLNSPAFQLGLVDHFAGEGGEVKHIASGFSAWRKVKDELARLREEERNAQSERDYLQFQFEELEAARLVAGEQPELERALSRAENAGELVGAFLGIEEGINADRGIAALLATLRQHTIKGRPAG